MPTPEAPTDTSCTVGDDRSDTEIFACGIGIGSRNRREEWLEVFYPQPVLKPKPQWATDFRRRLNWCGENQTIPLDNTGLQEWAALLPDSFCLSQSAPDADSQNSIVLTILATDAIPSSVPEAYLKLHLLSQRKCRPNQLNLEGLFSLLPNVAWTSEGPMDPEEVAGRRWQMRRQGRSLQVYSVDKFPALLNYALPSGVRIGDGARVRLGAWLGEGVTVMHEGFVNFNAGAAGPNMIEGRISAGVCIGAGSDLGGGSSTMGTLSGGNQIQISVGCNCLIGANAGTGIPLGDNCVIEAGLYLTAGAVVTVLDSQGQILRRCKLRELAGKSALLFRRNSVSGALECLPNPHAVKLNPVLHQND